MWTEIEAMQYKIQYHTTITRSVNSVTRVNNKLLVDQFNSSQSVATVNLQHYGGILTEPVRASTIHNEQTIQHSRVDLQPTPMTTQHEMNSHS